jgi:hypothetical protein
MRDWNRPHFRAEHEAQVERRLDGKTQALELVPVSAIG